MRYYTVNLFDVKYEHPYRGQIILATTSPVIIKRGLFSATELLTGQKIDILPSKALDGFGVVDKRYQDKEQFTRTGYHLAIREDELVPKNFTTVEEIDSYVDDYEYSEYKEIYESMKQKNGLQAATTPTVMQKAKAVRNTKK